MSTLAVIPARGGSKGVPRKNVRILGGRPLITYTIEDARTAVLVNRVVVSTDDIEIKEVSLRWGVEVVDRPAEIAGDKASSETALLHVLDVLEMKEGYVPDVIVFLQCTSPLRRPHDVDDAIRLFIDRKYDSVFSAMATHHFRWQQRGDVMARVNFPVVKRPMRQDMETEYVENGSIYVMTSRLLRETGLRLGGRIGCHEMPLLYSLDMDTEQDLMMLEALIALRETRVPIEAPGGSE